MVNLLKAEIYKLVHSQSFLILEVLSFLLYGVLLLDSKGLTTDFFCAALYNTPLLYFLIIIFTALFVGNDFGQQTLHTYIYTGHKRSSFICKNIYLYNCVHDTSTITHSILWNCRYIKIQSSNMYQLDRCFYYFNFNSLYVFSSIYSCNYFPRYREKSGSIYNRFLFDDFCYERKSRATDRNVFANGTISPYCFTTK